MVLDVAKRLATTGGAMSKKTNRPNLRKIAAVLGAVGGAAKSAAKTKAARENAKLPRPGRRKDASTSVRQTKKS